MKPNLLSVIPLVITASLHAEPVTYTPPTETALLKSAPGSTEAMTQCMTCHSAEYVSSQPTLPRATWKALVLKMQKVHGAPILDAQVDALVEYLTKTYGDEKAASHKSGK